MDTVLYVFGILCALAVLAVVFEALRRRRLRERHAMWWIVAGLAALLVSIFPESLVAAAGYLGVDVPTNLVFFVSIATLFFVCIQTGAELTSLEAKTRRLAEALAIVDERVNRLEAEHDAVDKDTKPAE